MSKRRILAIGSSSTEGIGASSPDHTYPAQLEDDLAELWKEPVTVVNSGRGGETVVQTIERLEAALKADKYDLVIWQVGTNDALARVPVANFATTLDGTLRWLAERRVDTVIVDPQYTSRLGTNDVYTEFIDIIEEVARRNRVPLVRRFEAMQYLAQVREGAEKMYLAGDHFHLNDLGYRCMAEQAARAITLSLLQSE